MKSVIICLVLCGVIYTCRGQQDMSQTALKFLNSLNPDQKKKAQYGFTDEERFNWNYVPKDRKGISFNDMNESQKALAYTLMRSGLGADGYHKATEIIQLENILKVLEKRSTDDNFRDPGKYYFTIFGQPAAKGIWGWRVDGHHLSFTFSASDNKIVSGTPGFMGSNPAIVPDGPQKGKQILKPETDKAFELLQSFSVEDLRKVMFSNSAPSEIITGSERKAMITEPRGITYAQMKKNQQALLIQLLEIYINRYTKLFADDMMKEIHTAGLDKLQFAWAGAQRPETGNAYYYRITGPTIIIEFDNSQNNANHVHTVVRDLKRDFGGDELLEHYKQSHQTNN